MGREEGGRGGGGEGREGCAVIRNIGEPIIWWNGNFRMARMAMDIWK